MKALKTYYNGRCPVCRGEIERYARSETAGDIELTWCDINRDEAALAHLGITADEVRKRLHAIDGRDRVLVGVPVFAAIWDELEGYRWLARLVRMPGLGLVAHWLYEALAAVLWWRNRRRMRRASAEAGAP